MSGASGRYARWLQVVKRLMLSSDRSSGSDRFARLLHHHQRELERTDPKNRAAAGGSATMARAPVAEPLERGVVGGNLDRLVRGTIACDSLATLASHLLQLEPVLVSGLLVDSTSRWIMSMPGGRQCTLSPAQGTCSCVHNQ